jgi:hypothetical protein
LPAEMPHPTHARAPCPRCGAETVDQASTRCRPERDETGEGTCPSDLEDAEGYLLQPTPAYIAWLGQCHALTRRALS